MVQVFRIVVRRRPLRTYAIALPTFPVSLVLTNRPVLLVGGGELALRKARLLSRSGCRLIVVDSEPDASFVALPAEVRRRVFQPDDLKGMVLVLAATEEAWIAETVSRHARALGFPLNAVDRPDLSTFIIPAIVDRDPITIAISSGGASPILVRRLRERLEAALEPGIGRVDADLGGEVRQQAGRGPFPDTQRPSRIAEVGQLHGQADAVFRTPSATVEGDVIGRQGVEAGDAVGSGGRNKKSRARHRGTEAVVGP